VISSSDLPASKAVWTKASDIYSVDPISIISGVKLRPNFSVIFLILDSSGCSFAGIGSFLAFGLMKIAGFFAMEAAYGSFTSGAY
jgi:hypothetical protein